MQTEFTETEYAALSDEKLQELDISAIKVVPDPVGDTEAEESNDSSANVVEETENTEQDLDDLDENEDEEEDPAEEEEEETEEGETEDASEEESEEEEGVSDSDAAMHKEFYTALTAPFKANGVDIQLKSADEWISMAQKGANYTQKMQGLAPNLKLLRMLENHNLLDESKLSFLIDLDKRDPNAIQKYMKDGQIDPMDVDTDADSSYVAKSYGVSDKEHNFRSTLEEVSASGFSGKELIKDLNSNWDAESKDKLFENAQILRILHEQKQSGVYDTIMHEVKRRQVLGQLIGQSHLDAYSIVGKELDAAGQLVSAGKPDENTGQQAHSQNPAPKKEVRTRTRRRVSVSEDKRASAAAPSRSGGISKKPKQDFNPLSMSDEEFNKMFGGS